MELTLAREKGTTEANRRKTEQKRLYTKAICRKRRFQRNDTGCQAAFGWACSAASSRKPCFQFWNVGLSLLKIVCSFVFEWANLWWFKALNIVLTRKIFCGMLSHCTVPPALFLQLFFSFPFFSFLFSLYSWQAPTFVNFIILFFEHLYAWVIKGTTKWCAFLIAFSIHGAFNLTCYFQFSVFIK